MNRFCLLFLLLGCVQTMAQKKSRKEYLVSITTNYGEMKAILHDQTPLHKQNFLKLINDRFYDSLLFHRIIEGFMIQGGDPTSKKAKPGERLGGGGAELARIPAEFKPELFHKKGALAAARNNNPEKKSSGCQFYIVQGRVWDAEGLSAQLKRGGRVPTAAQKEAYTSIGGTPHLDGGYTVFGQVISGLAVVDSIARQPKDQADRPFKDVRMSMTVKKMKKKKITKQYGYVFE
ncbi:peptidylprolyl isomerase [Runella slithyformis]|uniref:peptidylprolyl isomerase n=1 Tax=Runella slithyformis (strain ATCC 29530 / DSM 19594 / LMG 11500 / NCIMB 11436 / LSU 4) TaxID=761193 RepID=A0A7U4E4G9_RUNSL|nr:peptidylprolyl isomerase [Runella slithyformis]AEI47274.1 peptidyl-prolyl cis-trans isomerase cyclophilin type [Runella slithyformis DSM 19594]